MYDTVGLKDRKKRVLHVGEAHLNVPNSKKHCFDEKMPPFKYSFYTESSRIKKAIDLEAEELLDGKDFSDLRGREVFMTLGISLPL